MSGPGEGKLELKDARVYLCSRIGETLLEKSFVYIHVKGYSLAKVTHLDVEHELLNDFFNEKGKFLGLKGIKGGIEIKLDSPKLLNKNKIYSIKILHPFLQEVLPEERKTRTWVGGKKGGIYIGFRKEQIEKLEKIAREKLKFPF